MLKMLNLSARTRERRLAGLGRAGSAGLAGSGRPRAGSGRPGWVGPARPGPAWSGPGWLKMLKNQRFSLLFSIWGRPGVRHRSALDPHPQGN